MAQTPVVRYENRKTGRTVTIIVTMHVGTNAYFTQLNEIIAGLEATGALICYEGIRTHEELSAKGVTFLQEPSERPYGSRP